MEQFKKLDKKNYNIDKEEFIECILPAGQEHCLGCFKMIENAQVIYVYQICTHWICVDCSFQNDEFYYCPLSCNRWTDYREGRGDYRGYLTVTDKVVETWCPLKLIRVKIEEQEEELTTVKREYMPYDEWYRRDAERDAEIALLRKRVRELEENLERVSKKMK